MITLNVLLFTSNPAAAGYEEAKKEGRAMLYTSLNLEERATALRDLWNGKAAINLNNYSWIYAMLHLFGQEKGMDFLRTFAIQNPKPGRGTTLMVQQWLAGGEVELALPLNHDGINRFKEKGVPVD